VEHGRLASLGEYLSKGQLASSHNLITISCGIRQKHGSGRHQLETHQFASSALVAGLEDSVSVFGSGMKKIVDLISLEDSSSAGSRTYRTWCFRHR